MKVLHYLILLGLQFLCLPVFSQKPQVSFTYVSANESRLSQNSVNCMLKDSYGMMWFGTQEGLNKYDGYKFTVYKKRLNDPKTIIANDIYSIIEDKEGNIWIAAIGAGISMYDRKTDSFVNFTEIKNDPGSLSSKQAYTIYEDRHGNIWIGTVSGLNLLDKKTKKFTRFFVDPKNPQCLSSNDILCLYEDKKGNFWIGTRLGLNLMDRKTGKCRQYLHNPSDKNSIADNTVHKIMEDSYGNIWIGTNTGLELFDRDNGAFTHFKSSYMHSQGKGEEWPVYAITQDRDHLWIGSNNLSLFDISMRSYIGYDAYSDNNKNVQAKEIYSLLLDNQNILWVGTSGDGIYKYEKNLSRFAAYRLNDPNSVYNMITSFAEDQKGNIWIGTYAGLTYFDRTSKKISVSPASKKIAGAGAVINLVFQTPGNKIWFGSNGRLDLLDPASGLYEHFTAGETPSHFNGNTIECVFEDSRGDTWIGTGKGVSKWDNKKKQFTRYQHETENTDSTADNSVSAICEDKHGNIWIGTWYNGVYILNTSTQKFTHYNTTNSKISGDIISTFLKDRKNDLWIGTMDGGLNRYDPQTNDFISFTEEQGLINNVINSVLEDEQGYLWISTNKGLTRFDTKHATFKSYTTYNGLQGDEFNVAAGFKAKNGEIFFGGLNGFNVFDPAILPENNSIPPLVITGFELFNKPVVAGDENGVLEQSISVTKEIVLSYDQSVFTFEFAALNYVFPGKNQYAYKMEGFDKEWIHAGTQKKITYTNLDPGKYVFKVKASNNDGVWNEEGVSIKITIKPPFWQTWWFRLMVVVILAGAVFLFIRIRMRQAKRRQKILEQKVKDQTIKLVHANEEERRARQNADKANEELERKNKEIEQFVYIASHDLREPLRTTASFVKLLQQEYKGNLSSKADTYLTFMGQSTERMKILINDLLDYSRLSKNKEWEQVDCNLVVQEVLADIAIAIKEAEATITVAPLPVITALRTGMKQVFQNLIANAIKFRKKDIKPVLRISAELENDNWKFSVTDNGIGIDKQHADRIFVIFQRLHTVGEYDGSGIGLAHCKKIIELHNGTIWVQSTPGEGSVFYFNIPLNKQ